MAQELHEIHSQTRPQVVSEACGHDLVARLPADYARVAVDKKALCARQIKQPQDLLQELLADVLSTCSWRVVSCWAILIDLAEMSHRAWGKRLRQAGPWLRWLLSQLLVALDAGSVFPWKGDVVQLFRCLSSRLWAASPLPGRVVSPHPFFPPPQAAYLLLHLKLAPSQKLWLTQHLFMGPLNVQDIGKAIGHFLSDQELYASLVQ